MKTPEEERYSKEIQEAWKDYSYGKPFGFTRSDSFDAGVRAGFRIKNNEMRAAQELVKEQQEDEEGDDPTVDGHVDPVCCFQCGDDFDNDNDGEWIGDEMFCCEDCLGEGE